MEENVLLGATNYTYNFDSFVSLLSSFFTRMVNFLTGPDVGSFLWNGQYIEVLKVRTFIEAVLPAIFAIIAIIIAINVAIKCFKKFSR